MAAELPEDIRQFLGEYVESVLQLELLLLLRAGRARAYSADDLARELRIDRIWAAEQAELLCATGLVECERGPLQQFRFQPRTAALEEVVARTAEYYATRRLAIITHLYSGSSPQVKRLADAFKLRRDKPSG